MNQKIIPEYPMLCPECGSDETYQYCKYKLKLNEYENIGHAYLDYDCLNCGEEFSVCLEFNYEITNHLIR